LKIDHALLLPPPHVLFHPIQQVPSLGLFASAGPDYTDASTWSFVAGSDAPNEINRFALPTSPSQPGQLWASANHGGVWSGRIIAATSAGAGVEYDETPRGAASGTADAAAATASKWGIKWDVSGALADADVPFSGIALSADARTVVVMSFLTNSNQSIWRSDDGGSSFHRLNFTVNSSVPWWGEHNYQVSP
jgi:hypothetical protein